MKKNRFIANLLILLISVSAFPQNTNTGEGNVVSTDERNDNLEQKNKYTIENFKEDFITPNISEINDNTGQKCACIIFSTEGNGFSVDDAVTVDETTPGQLKVYFPCATEIITIHHPILGSFRYKLPIKLGSRVTYTATIEVKKQYKRLIGRIDPFKYIYGNLEFNVMPFLGPTISIGYKWDQLSAELGFTYGFSKTDDIYYYGSGATILSAYNYQAMRLGLRLGYSISITKKKDMELTPLVGVAYTIINGKEINAVTTTNRGYMDGFNTMSATLGARLSFKFPHFPHWELSLTPEYDLGIYKDDNYDKVKEMNTKLKSWTDGFCLSAALKYNF